MKKFLYLLALLAWIPAMEWVFAHQFRYVILEVLLIVILNSLFTVCLSRVTGIKLPFSDGDK